MRRNRISRRIGRNERISLNRAIKRNVFLEDRNNKNQLNFEKINTVLNSVLAIISTILAIITFNQQQDIKGMSALLEKQDSLINKLAFITSQNSDLIKAMKVTQEIALKQTAEIRNQVSTSQYSSKPLMNINGVVYLQKISTDTTDRNYRIQVAFKNNGFRSANDVSVSVMWLMIENDEIISSPVLRYNFPNNFLPSEENHLDFKQTLNQQQVNLFYNHYIACAIRYTDELTKKKEENLVIVKQFKLDENRISYQFVNGQQLARLRKYVVINRL